MTETEYRKVRAGATVRTLREMTNAYMVIPAGTLMTVHHKHNGFELVGVKACECCAVRPVMRKVQAHDVALEAHA